MSILRQLDRRTEARANSAEVTAELSRRRSYGAPAGVPVTPSSAMQHSGVWSSVNLIADTLSTTPVHAFIPDGNRLLRQPTPQILREPSVEVDIHGWIRQAIVSDLMRGNAYGYVVDRDRFGVPIQAEIVHPDVVGVKRKRRFDPLEFTIDGKPVPRRDVWHFPAYIMPGSPLGLSPLQVARQAISLGLAAENYSADWYRQGGHPTGIISTEQPIPDPEAADTVRERVKDSIAEHGVAVLGLGMKYTAMQISPSDAAFLETTQANLATIARYFGLEPAMIGASTGDSQTYANVESRALNYLTFNLNHWIVRFEAKLGKLLPAGLVARFNADSLARVTLKTRYDAHSIGLRSGFLTQNEVRELENRDPLEGGDVAVWPPLRAFPTPTDGDKSVDE